ncbi:hypothetical protein ZWY2020_054573 [Hordeum vulgare]|nr:hypothetical protein ZWY2020_054573 [Hordeum vulgare]
MFVTMFNPVSTIMVAILAYFIFGENLYVGRSGGHPGLYMLPGQGQGSRVQGSERRRESLLPDLDYEKQQRQQEKMVGVSSARGGSEQETRTTR